MCGFSLLCSNSTGNLTHVFSSFSLDCSKFKRRTTYVVLLWSIPKRTWISYMSWSFVSLIYSKSMGYRTYTISLSFAKNVSAAPTWAGLPVSDLLKIWRLNTYVRFFSALLKLNRNTIMWSPASLVWSISLKLKARLIHSSGWFYLSFSLYIDLLALSQNSLRIRHGGFSLLYSK